METNTFSVSSTTDTKSISFHRVKSWLTNFGITVAGLIAGLLLAELILSFMVPPPIRWYYPQPFHVPDKELGWVMTPNQHSYTHDKTVTTNSLGLRSPEISLQKQPGELRILCLGDSQTFGNGVSQEETYPARLESILRSRAGNGSIQVINAGVQGYNTIQEVRQLEKLAPALRPDVVTVGFYLNDIVEVTQPIDRFAFDAARGEFKRTGLIKQFTPYKLIYLLKRSRLVTFVYSKYTIRRMTAEENITKAVLLGKTPAKLEPAWPLIRDSLVEAQKLAKALNFRLIAFPIPAVQEFLGKYPDEQYRSRFLNIARELGFDEIDPTPGMKSAGGHINKYFITWDGHINPTTHNLVAELLANKIKPPPTRS